MDTVSQSVRLQMDTVIIRMDTVRVRMDTVRIRKDLVRIRMYTVRIRMDANFVCNIPALMFGFTRPNYAASFVRIVNLFIHQVN